MVTVRLAELYTGLLASACDMVKNGMEDDEGDRITRDLFNDVHKYLAYNPKRLYYGGFSGGAMRSYRLSYLMKDKCSGILAFGGWLGGKDFHKKPYQRNMRIAMVNGASDSSAKGWEADDTRALKSKQCTVKVFRFEGGHQLPAVETVDKAINWLDAGS